MVSWNSLDFGDADSTTSFNDTAAGGAFFQVGTHKGVSIDDIERKDSKAGNPMLVLTITNEEGASILNYVSLIGTDKEGNVVPHFAFRNFISAVIPDRELRADFLKLAYQNTELLEELSGCLVTIKIAAGEDGYDIRETTDGQYTIYDMEDGLAVPDLSPFDSYTDAKEHAEEELGMNRCYNRVAAVLKASAEDVESNLQGVREILADAPTQAVKAKKTAAARL